MTKEASRFTTRGLVAILALSCVSMGLPTAAAAAADTAPSFRLDVDIGSVFAPNAGVTLTVQGCNCSAVTNEFNSAIRVEIDGQLWRTLAAHEEDPTCGCLPASTEGKQYVRVDVKDADTGAVIVNASMSVGSYSFFHVYAFLDNSQRPRLSTQPVYPTIVLNYTTPNDPDGKVDQGWAMKPNQILGGRTAKFKVPELPAGARVDLGALVRVTTTMGLVGEINPTTPLPVDPTHPADFTVEPFYTAAGPAFAGAGTVLTITGQLLPDTNHVALLLPAGNGGQLTTSPAKSDSLGSSVKLEVPAAIDDRGLKPGEFNILLQELRYTGADGKDHTAQMGSTQGPFVFKYQDNNSPQPPSSPSSPSPVPYVFLGIGGVLAAGTGLFIFQRRRRRYSEIAGK